MRKFFKPRLNLDILGRKHFVAQLNRPKNRKAKVHKFNAM